jgi:hypothetical protein
MEEAYDFVFAGDWTEDELTTLQAAISTIEAFLNSHPVLLPGIEWVWKYLPVRFKHGSLMGNNFVFYGTMYLMHGFTKRTVIHEFGHVLDNNIGYTRRRERRILGNRWPRPLDAAIFGEGPSDDLFIAMGGIPKGIRFSNGDNHTEYRNDVGVMKTLPEGARFCHKHYANHCTADYFAETWEALVMGDDMTKPKAPPTSVRHWMENFISTLR